MHAVFKREKLQTNDSSSKGRGWRRNYIWNSYYSTQEGCPLLFSSTGQRWPLACWTFWLIVFLSSICEYSLFTCLYSFTYHCSKHIEIKREKRKKNNWRNVANSFDLYGHTLNQTTHQGLDVQMIRYIHMWFALTRSRVQIISWVPTYVWPKTIVLCFTKIWGFNKDFSFKLCSLTGFGG